MIVVGAPLVHGTRVLNCAVVIQGGRVLGVAPKSYLPNYREFYERRHFAPGDDLRGTTIRVAGDEVPLGPDLIFAATDLPDLRLHVEICEDMWVPVPPSAEAALAGATVLANLSGSPITIARAEDRRLLVRSASFRSNAAYVFAAAGQGESTTDLSWDGQTMIYECGDLLGESERFPDGPRRTVVDVDLDRIRQDRLRQGTFDDNRRGLDSARPARSPFRTVGLRADAAHRRHRAAPPGRPVPVRARRRRSGWPWTATRPTTSRSPDSSSGLRGDRAAQGRDRRQRWPRLHARADRRGARRWTGSSGRAATSSRSRCRASPPATPPSRCATRLAKALGVTFEEIDIKPAAEQLLKDLDHPAAEGEAVYDVTYENVQAGLRYDYLFRLANQRGGIVVGTGDLSELALGWCTYGVGDQMSHYNVNAGVPKTLIQHLIRWVIESGQFDDEANDVLGEMLDQEITPELIPTVEGQKAQSTEDTVGPYALQDFTLYHVLRRGYRPSKIAFLAWHAWHDADAGEWPPGYPPEVAAGVRPRRDPALARGLLPPLLRQPVQAQRPAQRAEGERRRHHEPARRLADAQRRGGHRLAGRDRGARPAVLRSAQPFRARCSPTGENGPRGVVPISKENSCLAYLGWQP